MPLQFETLSSHGLRRLVRDLRHALVAVGQPPLSQHVAQEVVARQLGHADWHAAHHQALRVDRAQILAAAGHETTPPVARGLSNPQPTSTFAEHAAVSDESLKHLPLFPVEVGPEAQAVIALLREGNSLYDSALAYHAVRQESAQKAAKDEWRPQDAKAHLGMNNWELSLALATTPGPWIQSWRLADAQGLQARGLHPERVDEVMSDEAFNVLVEFLVPDKEGGLLIAKDDICRLLSGSYLYGTHPFQLIEHGHMAEASAARTLLESPKFEKEVRADLPTALEKLQPLLIDSGESLSYEDAFGAIQRLASMVARTHPDSSVKLRVSKNEEIKEPSRLGNLRLKYALTLQEVQDELTAVIEKPFQPNIALDVSSKGMIVKLQEKLDDTSHAEPDATSRRRRSRHP